MSFVYVYNAYTSTYLTDSPGNPRSVMIEIKFVHTFYLGLINPLTDNLILPEGGRRDLAKP